MSDERRRFSRVFFGVQAQLTVEGQTFKAGLINDLGIGGCHLPLAAPAAVGSPCRVAIFLSGADSEPAVQVEGEIVRRDSGLIAIKFTAIDPDSLFHLQNIILHNTPDPDKAEKEISNHPGLL
jgi:PilZ domain